MKTILATLVAVAALSLGACSKPDGEANLAGPAEASFNESDIPAEGNAGGLEDFTNSTAGLDNPATDNALTPVDNAAVHDGNVH